ncbi:MAG: hypothetical protein ACK54C_01985 [Betaproteobacteria bacterium]
MTCKTKIDGPELAGFGAAATGALLVVREKLGGHQGLAMVVFTHRPAERAVLIFEDGASNPVFWGIEPADRYYEIVRNARRSESVVITGEAR